METSIQLKSVSAQVMRTGGKAEFELMYKELVAWKEKYYTCVVPKQVLGNYITDTSSVALDLSRRGSPSSAP